MSDSFVCKQNKPCVCNSFPQSNWKLWGRSVTVNFRWMEIWKVCSSPAISDASLLADKKRDPKRQKDPNAIRAERTVSKAQCHICTFCHQQGWLCCVLYSTGLRLHKLIASASLPGPQPHQNIITMKPRASSYPLRIHSLSTLSWFGICMNPSPPIQTLRLSYKQACSCRADQPYCLPACERVV